ncbi:hypothetical protein TRFO_16119 [Tritrichomonas foetus]|uniref:Right handed beta helix domain-containing protein n=1 Tax=Tritrichomonas foetus TaxID=1144522 RepID=A0A1J4KVC7_9EUKA|nr:hypothetical protein TRFO_16119 [Tritrichomonas foetus]|eukprot:OHT13684.1 hypothetical protein TRFO_16119 [Tritrichomonas foetus]
MLLFSLLICYSSLQLSRLSVFLSSISNGTITSKNCITPILSTNPIFLGLPKFSPLSLKFHSLKFHTGLISPIIYGIFGKIHLDKISVSKSNSKLIQILGNTNYKGNFNYISDSKLIKNEENNTDNYDVFSFNNKTFSEALQVFFSCEVKITNCHFENFVPNNTRDSILQIYDSNCTINQCSFFYGSSQYCPVMFATLSKIDIFSSNFSYNVAKSDGNFGLYRCNGKIHSCFIGNCESGENGAFELLESSFSIKNNAIIHNRAETNSIVYITKSNASLHKNYFVANRLSESCGTMCGVVSVYDDKAKTEVEFQSCIFTKNREYETNNKIVCIFYWGDETVPLVDCAFDSPRYSAIIVFDKGIFNEQGSTSYETEVATLYDIFDDLPFDMSGKAYSMNFSNASSRLFMSGSILLVLFMVVIVFFALNNISGGFFPYWNE